MSDDVSSALRLVTAPTAEPITLAQAKLFLRVEHTADDEAITRAISAARQQAETYLRIALLPQTWDYVVANAYMETICLPYGPAQSITSVTQTNEAGSTTTVNAANYRLSVDGFAVLFFNVSSAEIATIRYVAGSYNAVANVPAMIVQGMLHHIAVMMETRDGAVPLPMQSVQCYQPYRRVML